MLGVMKPRQTGAHYDRIAEWWLAAQMKNPEYGMEYIMKAVGYAPESIL